MPTRESRGKAAAKRLTGKQRRHLRALAHHLEPVVQIGAGGLTRGVLSELGRALEAHELIKVRVARDSPMSPRELVDAIETGTRSHVAQLIGRTLIVYRRREAAPKIELPRARGKSEPAP